jgi:peptide/nickel transport system permease protein
MASPAGTAAQTQEAGVPQKEDQQAGKKFAGFGFYVRFISKDIPALVGAAMIAVFLGFGLIEGIMQTIGNLLHKPQYGYMLLPANPLAFNFANSYIPPCGWGSSSSCFSAKYFLGTNNEGQSILARLLYATPHDALACVLVVSVGVTIGMLVGTTAGYFGGWVDEVLMRLTDTFLALPGLILAIAIAVLLSGLIDSYTAALISLLIIWWPTYARFFKGQTVAIKNRGYIEAAKLGGVNPLKILVKHIFPNAIDPVIAYATLDFGSVILIFATLAFLGVGVVFGYPEWGNEAAVGLQFFPEYWWLAIIPSLLIMAVVIAFTLVGDRLQDLIGGRTTY